MATLSGKDGKIKIGSTTLADILGWDFETKSGSSRYASSATGGYKKGNPGVKEGSGSAKALLNPADALTANFTEGSQVTLLLYIDATHFFSVPSNILTVKYSVDIDNGGNVTADFTFENNGAWALPTYP